ncbi:type II secretion system F family protein [Actinomycetes bacterium M1A6_2h]
MTWACVLLAAALLAVPMPGRRRMQPALAVETSGPAPQHDPMAVAGAFDLLSACLRSGTTLAAAASAVAPTAPEPLASALTRGAHLLTLGADPVAAWESVATDLEGEALARMARRSARSGSSMADAIAELAAERRNAAEDAAVAAAERAGVLIGGPLGLCFLPAFVCLGIVPVVIGLARTVLSGGLL